MGDLILSEGSELHGIVLYIVRPVCRQFDHDNLLQIFEFDVSTVTDNWFFVTPRFASRASMAAVRTLNSSLSSARDRDTSSVCQLGQQVGRFAALQTEAW